VVPHDSSIAGGYNNDVRGAQSSINGGRLNTVNADFAAILGGSQRTIVAGDDYTTYPAGP
jgi:hypothetical protein